MVCSTYNFTCAVTNITLDFISEHVAGTVTGSRPLNRWDDVSSVTELEALAQNI
jgi:hypothetical protein